MIVTATSGNRHIVDQLADVRAEIRELQAKESGLKEAVGHMMGSADSLGGDEFIASQAISERKGSLDEKAIAKALGVDNLDQFRKPATPVVTIRVERRISEVA